MGIATSLSIIEGAISMEIVVIKGAACAAGSGTEGAAAAAAAERKQVFGGFPAATAGDESARCVGIVCFALGVIMLQHVVQTCSPSNFQHKRGGGLTTVDTRQGGHAQPAFEAGAGTAAMPPQRREKRFERKRCALNFTLLGSICVWSRAGLGGVVPPGRERSPTKCFKELARKVWDPIGGNEDVLFGCTRGLKPAGGVCPRFFLILGPCRTFRAGFVALKETRSFSAASTARISRGWSAWKGQS